MQSMPICVHSCNILLLVCPNHSSFCENLLVCNSLKLHSWSRSQLTLYLPLQNWSKSKTSVYTSDKISLNVILVALCILITYILIVLANYCRFEESYCDVMLFSAKIYIFAHRSLCFVPSIIRDKLCRLHIYLFTHLSCLRYSCPSDYGTAKKPVHNTK